jgi:hypothetical protein
MAAFASKAIRAGLLTLRQESPHERAERYMRQATEVARLAARSADQEIAATYLEMARVWLKLAAEVRIGAAANEDLGRADDTALGR